MTWGFRPLVRGSTSTGALFPFLGAAASTVLLPFAVLLSLLWESGPAAAPLPSPVVPPAGRPW